MRKAALSLAFIGLCLLLPIMQHKIENAFTADS